MEFLKVIEKNYLNKGTNVNWGSVSSPFKTWPSIFNLKEWNKHPKLKMQRLSMWISLSEELQKLQINNLVDIGTSSGQFVLCCLFKGINAYGIDPSKHYLFSNSKDFIESGYDPKNHLYLGDVETFIDVFDHKLDCVSLLNFFHGQGWNGRDLSFLKCINDKIKYLVISYPLDSVARQYIEDNYKILYEYKQELEVETTFILKRI